MTSRILLGQHARRTQAPLSQMAGGFKLPRCQGAVSFDGSILFGFTLMRVPELVIAGCGKLRAQPASNDSKCSLYP
jgi:hypothetical protein